jgi:hypothetical protein
VQTITLAAIKAEHSKIAEMIATFEAQAATTYIFPEAEIALSSGEHYAGIVLGKDGEASYHLILLDGSKESINWKDAGEWAASIGGTLPNRREQALLYANLKEQFDGAWYWSSEQLASLSGYAWIQHFFDGYQGLDNSRKNGTCRARAVRRLAI